VAYVVEGRHIAEIWPLPTRRCTVADLAEWLEVERPVPAESTAAVTSHVRRANRPRATPATPRPAPSQTHSVGSRYLDDHRPGYDPTEMPRRAPTAVTGAASVTEVCRRIRVARSYWDAHNNRACRGEREKALALYETLTEADRKKVPQVLRVWLRYRSEKYFGADRTPPRSRGRL
jgi:hypothetical protein